jgi:hypothetical protein
MTEEQIALAKRAVACKGWRWMPGMLGFDPDGINDPVRVAFPPGKAYRMPTLSAWGRPSYIVHCELPDLTDPATLGCLLALVREAWNDAKVHVLYVDGLYRWECADRHNVHGSGMTEAEALVDALEYAT